MKDSLLILFEVLYIINIFFAFIIVFVERKNHIITWAWLVVVLFVPYIGFLIYILLGFDTKKNKSFQKKIKLDKIILDKYLCLDINKDILLKSQKQFIEKENILNIPNSQYLNDLIYLNILTSYAILSNNNKIKIFNKGIDKFKTLLNDIDNSKSFIHIQYYIIRNDEIGKTLVKHLTNKAKQNIEVKLLIDGMGCCKTSKKLFKPLMQAGGKVETFFSLYGIKLNYRNHRKICVIDGKIGYIGGFNVGDEYLGKIKKYGNWKDCHIKVIGDAVKELEIRFLMDWNYTSKKHKIDIISKYFPYLKDIQGTKMQVVSSGADTKYPNIQYSYTKMITEASKSIYIQSPYFIPDISIVEMLKIASLSSIDVKIMIPANPDHPFVYWAALSYLRDLSNYGVKCYQYNNGFIHSKLIMIDSKITSIGTANMDIRSLKLNFETNAFIYGLKETMLFENNFLKDIEKSTIMDDDWYKKISNINKIKISFCRLLSPLL